VRLASLIGKGDNDAFQQIGLSLFDGALPRQAPRPTTFASRESP
jgi:hypothetical protein